MFSIEHLTRFSHLPALVLEDGTHLTYAKLLDDIERISSEIGAERKLVVLKASNTRYSLAAYIACLAHRHVVWPISSDGQHLDDLILRYRPNLVLSGSNDSFQIDVLHTEHLLLNEDLALLLSTSGSTGAPKAVRLSRKNIESNAASIVEYLALESSDRAVLNLPPYYSYGVSVINSHLACGASMVLSDRSVTEQSFWSACADAGVTNFSGVPHTFELMLKAGINPKNFSGLRFMTQAGGKMSDATIRHFAKMGNDLGFSFFVMYGQTEAAPRIAYLPPAMAATHPNCIGVAVPGGRLEVQSEEGIPITTPDVSGELVYHGPNVMMGYAESIDDLQRPAELECLRTGDIAARSCEGLFYITGRKSRFLKLFGLRIALDEVENHARRIFVGSGDVAATGTDALVIVTSESNPTEEDLRELCKACSLPRSSMMHLQVVSVPRLGSGKVDYAGIRRMVDEAGLPSSKQPAADVPDRLLSTAFLKLLWDEAMRVTGFKSTEWDSVKAIFLTTLDIDLVEPQDTFVSLGGDSLNYIQISVALEEYLGKLPHNWSSLTVSQLEAAAQVSKHAI